MWSSGVTLAMTLTLNLQGQIWNLLYLSQNGAIATKRKANISIDLKTSNVTIGLDLGHDLDLEFSRSNSYGIGYISAKNGPIATKRKASTSIEL